MQQAVYEHTFVPDFADFDSMGKLKLSALLHDLSECAGMACAELGYDRKWMMEHNHVYLLSQYRIEFFETYRYGEAKALQIKTWETGSKGASVIRNYCLTDDNDRLIGYVCSTWLLADPKNHKLLRPADFTGYVPRTTLDYPIKMIQKIEVELQEEHSFIPVRYSDLDMNQHVYNARYADIIMDVLPQRYQNAAIKEFEIRYKKEVKAGESLAIGVKAKGNTVMVYGMVADTVSFAARLSYADAKLIGECEENPIN